MKALITTESLRAEFIIAKWLSQSLVSSEFFYLSAPLPPQTHAQKQGYDVQDASMDMEPRNKNAEA